MTVLRVMSIRDSAVDGYASPVFMPSVGLAVRSFTDQVNKRESGNAVHEHPSDFELWHLADFHEDSGVFVLPDGGARMVARAVDLVAKG